MVVSKISLRPSTRNPGGENDENMMRLIYFGKMGDMENHQQVRCLGLSNIATSHNSLYHLSQNHSSQSKNVVFFRINFQCCVMFNWHQWEGFKMVPVYLTIWEGLFKKNTTERPDKHVSIMFFLLMLLWEWKATLWLVTLVGWKLSFYHNVLRKLNSLAILEMILEELVLRASSQLAFG